MNQKIQPTFSSRQLRARGRSFAHIAVTEKLVAIDGAHREDLFRMLTVNVGSGPKLVREVDGLERIKILSRMPGGIFLANQERWSGQFVGNDSKVRDGIGIKA